MTNKKNLRIFGYIWMLILLYVSYIYDMNKIFLALSIFFFISASFFPNLYLKTKIFQAWAKLGDLIGHINSQIIIFILFFFIFTPMGLMLKIFRKDLLSKKIDKEVKSYFCKRKTQAGSMINQF